MPRACIMNSFWCIVCTLDLWQRFFWFFSSKFIHQGIVIISLKCPCSQLTECRHFGELCIKLKKLQAKEYRKEHWPYCNQYFKKKHFTHSNLNAIFTFLTKYPLRCILILSKIEITIWDREQYMVKIRTGCCSALICSKITISNCEMHISNSLHIFA